MRVHTKIMWIELSHEYHMYCSQESSCTMNLNENQVEVWCQLKNNSKKICHTHVHRSQTHLYESYTCVKKSLTVAKIWTIIWVVHQKMSVWPTLFWYWGLHSCYPRSICWAKVLKFWSLRSSVHKVFLYCSMHKVNEVT